MTHRDRVYGVSSRARGHGDRSNEVLEMEAPRSLADLPVSLTVPQLPAPPAPTAADFTQVLGNFAQLYSSMPMDDLQPGGSGRCGGRIGGDGPGGDDDESAWNEFWTGLGAPPVVAAPESSVGKSDSDAAAMAVAAAAAAAAHARTRGRRSARNITPMSREFDVRNSFFGKRTLQAEGRSA